MADDPAAGKVASDWAEKFVRETKYGLLTTIFNKNATMITE